MSGTKKPEYSFHPSQAMPPITSVSDKNFLDALSDYIQSEKEYLQCPLTNSDEQRFIIYSTAFDKVIEYATAYKTILTVIKKEYDSFICAIRKSECKAKLAQGKLRARVAQPTSLMYSQRRAIQLQDRIAIIQRDTAELQAKLRRLQDSRKDKKPSIQLKTFDSKTLQPVGQIPGLTLDESLNPASLAKHLEFLEKKKADLQHKRKTQYVSKQVKADLDQKMKIALDQRDELVVDNETLQIRYKQLQYLNDAFTTWEKTGREVPLFEFITSKLEDISKIKVSETDCHGSMVFEEDDPSKVNDSELLVDYIEKFINIFEAGEYEAAAFHAAKSPHGVLRNTETMEKFKAVTEYQGDLPPLLLFFQALMISAHAGSQLPDQSLSVEAVCCALENHCVELVTHWVTQKRLTYSEALGDVICDHGDKKPYMADACLTLAHIIYKSCGVLRKAALSMCKRGMTNGVIEFVYQNKDFTADDCMYVLRGSPSLDMLRAFTQPYQGQPAILSVGFVCRTFLGSDLEDLALRLLDNICSAGSGALEKVIREDVACSGESWGVIAGVCAQRNHPQLSLEIQAILLSLDRAMKLSLGKEGAGAV